MSITKYLITDTSDIEITSSNTEYDNIEKEIREELKDISYTSSILDDVIITNIDNIQSIDLIIEEKDIGVFYIPDDNGVIKLSFSSKDGDCISLSTDNIEELKEYLPELKDLIDLLNKHSSDLIRNEQKFKARQMEYVKESIDIMFDKNKELGQTSPDYDEEEEKIRKEKLEEILTKMEEAGDEVFVMYNIDEAVHDTKEQVLSIEENVAFSYVDIDDGYVIHDISDISYLTCYFINARGIKPKKLDDEIIKEMLFNKYKTSEVLEESTLDDISLYKDSNNQNCACLDFCYLDDSDEEVNKILRKMGRENIQTVSVHLSPIEHKGVKKVSMQIQSTRLPLLWVIGDYDYLATTVGKKVIDKISYELLEELEMDELTESYTDIVSVLNKE